MVQNPSKPECHIFSSLRSCFIRNNILQIKKSADELQWIWLLLVVSKRCLNKHNIKTNKQKTNQPNKQTKNQKSQTQVTLPFQKLNKEEARSIEVELWMYLSWQQLCLCYIGQKIFWYYHQCYCLLDFLLKRVVVFDSLMALWCYH